MIVLYKLRMMMYDMIYINIGIQDISVAQSYEIIELVRVINTQSGLTLITDRALLAFSEHTYSLVYSLALLARVAFSKHTVWFIA